MANILIVEDDKLLSQAVATALEDAGYTPMIANNSQDAFSALDAQTISLIFLDIMLPGDDGYAVLGRLKREDAYAQIPVVMLSNLGQMEEIDRAMEMGALDYVTKSSVDLSKIVELAKKHIKD